MKAQIGQNLITTGGSCQYKRAEFQRPYISQSEFSSLYSIFRQWCKEKSSPTVDLKN